MNTTPTSGAADLPEALINIAREIEALKRDCGMDPESAIAIQNGRYMAISSEIRALAAGQATAAQQGAAHAALPESFLEIPDVQDESGINAYYSREAVLECIDAALASHGQAPAGAGEAAERYRNAIASACEGWTMPDGLRKHLETALWSPPSPTAQSADSVPAVSDLPPLPAPDLRDVGTKPQEIKEFLKGYATEYARTAIAASAPAGAGEPFGYFHQLLNHEGKGNGVWLGAAERKVVEQAHTPGETSEEIVALYAAPQPSYTAQAADSVPAVEREQERIAFKDAHRHLELDEMPDAWGRPMFKHSHVEASWLGWIARASHGQAPAGAKALAEADRRAGEAERLLATCKEEVMRFEQVRSRMKYQWGAEQRVSFDEIWDEALALKKAARADSVQEDAALWHWLAEYLVGPRTDLDDEIVASETVNDLRNLVEAAIKQGATQ